MRVARTATNFSSKRFSRSDDKYICHPSSIHLLPRLDSKLFLQFLIPLLISFFEFILRPPELGHEESGIF